MSPTRHVDHLETLAKSPLHSIEDTSLVTQDVLTKCNANLKKINEPRSHIKLLDNIPSIPLAVTPVDSPITTLSTANTVQEDEDNRSTVSFFLNYILGKKNFCFC